MIEWFNSLEPMLKIFWACALISSVLFVIQLLLLIIGVDSDSTDADFSTDTPDFDGDTTDLGGGFSLFSIKNMINFLVGFGWGGVCFYKYIDNPFLLTLAAFGIGLVFIGMFFIIYKQTRRFESNGAFHIKDCIDKTADVYLRIPAKGEGKGKIQISVNGSVHEIDAIAEDAMIPTGAKVRVTEVIDSTTVKVKAL